jgi:hypothetical protein
MTASLTARLLHGTLAPIPGDSSLGVHGGALLASGFAALASTLAASHVIGVGSRARHAVAFCSSFAFALALRLSNLSDPRRVLAFLLTPAHTAFDPSLVYLAIGAIPLASVLYRVGTVRVQNKGKVDTRLLAGAAMFGVGWGIEGICRTFYGCAPFAPQLTTIIGECSRPRIDQLRLGTCNWCRYQASRDMAGCRYHWGLLGAVIRFPLHVSLLLL